MNYLLDTHHTLWTLFEPEKISDNIIQILENDTFKKYVSGFTLWEISLKYSLGKLEFNKINPDQIYENIEESGFEIINIKNEVFSSYYKLPKKGDHKDPFDRLLIWQSIINDLIFITKDKKIQQYIENGLKVEFGT